MSDVTSVIEDLVQRVQALEDERAIHRTLVRYGFAVDSDDAEGLVALYTDDTVIEIDGSPLFHGSDGARALVSSPAHQAILPNCAHMIGPLSVEVGRRSRESRSATRACRGAGRRRLLDLAGGLQPLGAGAARRRLADRAPPVVRGRYAGRPGHPALGAVAAQRLDAPNQSAITASVSAPISRPSHRTVPGVELNRAIGAGEHHRAEHRVVDRQHARPRLHVRIGSERGEVVDQRDRHAGAVERADHGRVVVLGDPRGHEGIELVGELEPGL